MIKTYIAIPVVTKGNLLFRDKITIDTNRKILYYQKRNWNIFGYTNRSITFHDIAIVRLVHRAEWLLFSRVEIESHGGELITVSGLKSQEAKELKYYLDNLR
jgi:hypothetical protein